MISSVVWSPITPPPTPLYPVDLVMYFEMRLMDDLHDNFILLMQKFVRKAREAALPLQQPYHMSLIDTLKDWRRKLRGISRAVVKQVL